MSQPVLDFRFDPDRWVLGPADDKPFERWLPEAVQSVMSRFDIPAGNASAREAIEVTLATLGRFEDVLSYVIMFWPNPTKRPLPVYFGLEVRDDPADAADWLAGIDLTTVEKPVVDDVAVDRADVTLRRSLPYSTNDEGHVLVSARYVVDTGHPDFIVLAHAAAYEAADVIEIQTELVAMLGTTRIVQWDEPAP